MQNIYDHTIGQLITFHFTRLTTDVLSSLCPDNLNEDDCCDCSVVSSKFSQPFPFTSTTISQITLNFVACTLITQHRNVYRVYKIYVIDIRSPHVVASLFQFLLIFYGMVFYLFDVIENIVSSNTQLFID